MNHDTSPVPISVNGVKVGGGRVSRREAIQWVMGAVAASALPMPTLAQEVGRTVTPQENAARQPPPNTNKGYGVDPTLVKEYKPGELWPLTFNEAQKKAATALADTIIPKDHLGPAASDVGVVEMVDEWISAPYPQQQADRPHVLEILNWVDAEGTRRFQKTFAALNDEQRRAICDDVCFAGAAKPEFKKAAAGFSHFRSICAGAYYGTPAGWNAIGYVGNVALPSFDGPPPEVLQKLGVTQTVTG